MVDFADMSSRTRICKDMMNVCIRDEIKHPVSCDRIRKFDSEVSGSGLFSSSRSCVVIIFENIDERIFLNDEA